MAGNTSLAPELRSLCVNTIRFLAVDGVEAAKSGHPGAPMGLADIAFVLWSQFLRFNPADPLWPGRDRFILSNGHASMLLYSMLHLSGYEDVPVEQLRRFRQWGSKTPGHPEYGHTAGVEVTTGPLGQGFAHGVGMALAAEMAAARYNTADFALVDHYVYAICGDGDLMEGVSSEAASLAGHLGLGRLIYLYDDNEISIDGSTDLAFTEDVRKRFEAYGWHVQEVDGYDHGAVAQAVVNAQREQARPSLIICHTVIGYGSPNKANSAKSHGAPLGGDEVKLTKAQLGWPQEPLFLVPDEVRAHFDSVVAQRRQEYEAYQQRFAAWRQAHPELAALWEQSHARAVPADLETQLMEAVGSTKLATRVMSEKAIQKAAALVPWLVGGSADLAESNKTYMHGGGDVVPRVAAGRRRVDFAGRNLFFGVREFTMGAVVNGITLYGGFQGFGATFLVFSDYMRSAVRSSALMDIPSIWVYTHDSFYLGEDGPTHQPVEHLWSLRMMPNLTLFRPADGVETAMAWAYALREARGPVALALTRQNVLPLTRPAGFQPRQVWQGAYVVAEAEGGRPDLVLVATGSEVGLALGARDLLAGDGIRVRVVSMPSVERFEQQPAEYQEAVLGAGVPVAVVEAGRTDGWYRYAGRGGLVVGLDSFGASAPAEVLAQEFGFTPERVAARIREHLRK